MNEVLLLANYYTQESPLPDVKIMYQFTLQRLHCTTVQEFPLFAEDREAGEHGARVSARAHGALRARLRKEQPPCAEHQAVAIETHSPQNESSMSE